MTKDEMLQLKAMMQEIVKPVNKRLDGIDQRFDGIDQRLDGIDQRFDGIDQRFDGIDQRLDGIDQRFDGIDQRLDGIDERLDNIELRQTKFELIMENETNRAIKVIAEGHSIINRKLNEDLGLEDRVVTLENKVSAIEYNLNRTT